MIVSDHFLFQPFLFLFMVLTHPDCLGEMAVNDCCCLAMKDPYCLL